MVLIKKKIVKKSIKTKMFLYKYIQNTLFYKTTSSTHFNMQQIDKKKGVPQLRVYFNLIQIKKMLNHKTISDRVSIIICTNC